MAGATVRLVALTPRPCPCAGQDGGYAHDVPECACPAALAGWKQQLAACEWPPPAVAELTSDRRGQVSLTRGPSVTGIEVAHGDGVRWLAWPKTRGPIALALAPASRPLVTTKPRRLDVAGMRAAVVFEDGHCVPLDRAGDAWKPRSALPRDEGVLVVEAPGYRTLVSSMYSDESMRVSLHPDGPITGECDGTTVRLENPLQRLVARVDSSKRFSITGAIGMQAKVTCLKDADTVVGEWDWDPAEGLTDELSGGSGFINAPCHDVKVVDAIHRPVAGAEVMFSYDAKAQGSEGTSATTDARGIACLDALHAGGELHVFAPSELGGSCAGSASLVVQRRHLASSGPPTIRLRIQSLPGARTSGRVLSPDGAPVAGARVTVTAITTRQPDCSTSAGDAVTTDIDGTFTLAALPRGRFDVRVQHDWFVEREVTFENDGAADDIVLQRAHSWTGRVLDPDGAVIDTCALYLTFATGHVIAAKCTTTGFAFGAVPPGVAKVQARLENHALGTFRQLVRKVTIVGGKPHLEDLAFPKGEDISGRVVDPRGNAVPGARLTALPKDAREMQGRMHDDEVQIKADALGRFTFRHLTPGSWRVTGNLTRGGRTTLEVPTGSSNVQLVIPDAK